MVTRGRWSLRLFHHMVSCVQECLGTPWRASRRKVTICCLKVTYVKKQTINRLYKNPPPCCRFERNIAWNASLNGYWIEAWFILQIVFLLNKIIWKVPKKIKSQKSIMWLFSIHHNTLFKIFDHLLLWSIPDSYNIREIILNQYQVSNYH